MTTFDFLINFEFRPNWMNMRLSINFSYYLMFPPFKVKTFLFKYSGLISWVSNSKILMMKFYKRLYYYFSYYCCHIMLPNAVNLEQKMLEQKVFVCCLLTWNYNLFQMQLCCVSFANCKEELEIQINFKLKQNKIY